MPVNAVQFQIKWNFSENKGQTSQKVKYFSLTIIFFNKNLFFPTTG